MLTVTLTASDPAARKDGAGSVVRAASEKWGVGHPSAARRYQPPHPLFYPSRKKIPLSPPHSPLQTFYVPYQGHTQSHPQNAPYTPSRVSSDDL